MTRDTTRTGTEFGIAGRSVFTTGTYNARDAGGYPTMDGRRMASSTLFRSDALSHLSETDVEEASALGLRRVVDLRDPHELEAAPDVVIPGCEHRSVMLLEGTLAHFCVDDYPTLPELYDRLFRTHIGRLVEAVHLIAETVPDPVLVHCTAGKDRTGVVVAVVQSLARVPLDVIVADYSASERLLSARPGYVERVAGVYDRAGVDRRLMGADPVESPGHYLRDVLVSIERTHGSVEALLVGAGLPQASVDRLRSALVIG